METLAVYLPTKLATLFAWLNTRLDNTHPKKHTVEKKDEFLSDLVFFSSEEELTEYVNSFRGER